jgi:hypothetical protein
VRLAAFALVAAALAGCSAPADDTTADAGEGGADAAEEPDAGIVSIDVPATQGTWTVSEDVSFAGKGGGQLGAIAITHGTGTITFHGETAEAFFLVSTSTPTGTGDGGAYSGERDFEIVAASPDRLILAWITCANGTDLAYVYYDSTDGISSNAELLSSGTCTLVTQTTDEAVALPALSFPPPAVAPGFTISGAKIAYDGQSPGSADIAGSTWALYPFHVIDCTACATPGWFELHSLFFDPASSSASLGILYLQQAAPSSVELAYFIRLPSVDDPIGQQLVYPATWTSP